MQYFQGRLWEKKGPLCEKKLHNLRVLYFLK